MKIQTVISGFFKLDGGPMFGVVPRVMWSKMNPPDENNQCTWAMRSILIETGDRKILVDTGIGTKQDKKFRSIFSAAGPEATESLGEIQLLPEEITDVFLTHLHFDHAGGALTKKESGKIVPSFPNAVYWSNDLHYDWAYESNPREAASFLKENFVPLKEQGLIRMLPVQKEDLHWTDDIYIRYVYGHTTAMMILNLPLDEHRRLWYAADLIPSRWHIRQPYIMAYDLRPLDTLQEKRRLLEEIAGTEHVLYFEHDPELEAATIHKDERGRYALNQQGNLESFIK